MKVRNLSLLLIGGVVCTVLMYTGTLLILTWPIEELSINKSGIFGDSFGLLTSLFSGLAFAGIIITIVMQRDELALQRQELTYQREELELSRRELSRTADAQERSEQALSDQSEILRKTLIYQSFAALTNEYKEASQTRKFVCS